MTKMETDIEQWNTMNRIPGTASADRLRAALSGLVEKYTVPAPPAWTLHAAPQDTAGPHTMFPGWTALDRPPAAGCVPLLPWRSERRFVELRRLVDDQVVTPVRMARFACQTDGASLDLAAILYREFDLAEWLLRSRICSIAASITGPIANGIVRLTNDVVCGIESGAGLPPGTAMIDRHELIAGRGVACDRGVDTQIPQDSVYAFTAEGTARYTDADAELFGLEPGEVPLVRAAYETLLHPERADFLRQQHRRLAALVRLAFESDRRGQRLAVEGEHA
jgi:hypothetical protein